MAPVVEIPKPSVSDAEVSEVLKRAGIDESEGFQGRGGLGIVVAVAVFSSLAGLLMGLDIGYIAGIKTMESFAHGLLHEGS